MNFGTLFGVWCLVQAAAAGKDYDGYSLIAVQPDTEKKVDFLNNLKGLEFQVWQAGGVNGTFDIFVSPESKDELLARLDEKNIHYVTRTHNIQKALDIEKKPVSPRNRAFAGVQNAVQFTKYLKLDEMYSFIAKLAVDNAAFVKVETIGNSVQGRPIKIVKVGTDNGKFKPSIYIDGGIHAREWISSATVLYMLNKLVTGYKTDAKLKAYVDNLNWYFLPIVNVDGYTHTHVQDRMWRKNLAQSRSKQSWCFGVDLNRNFDYSFGGAGTSDDQCQDTYRGPQAFSEPETRAIRDFVLNHRSDMKAFMTIHAYSQLWFLPFADRRQNYPSDYKELEALSKRAVQALEAVGGARFQIGTPADILYPAAGGSFDWVKAVANIKYSFAMELRPGKNDHTMGFVLPPNQIAVSGEETWAAMAVVADEVTQKYVG